MNNIKISDNFNLKEFQCKCCGQVKIESKLLELLQKLRSQVGKPISVLSGYRCPNHNAEVGGAKESYHMKGMAVDIRIPNMSPGEVAKIAEQLGFNGIGLYDSFTHVDIRQQKSKWEG